MPSYKVLLADTIEPVSGTEVTPETGDRGIIGKERMVSGEDRSGPAALLGAQYVCNGRDSDEWIPHWWNSNIYLLRADGHRTTTPFPEVQECRLYFTDKYRHRVGRHLISYTGVVDSGARWSIARLKRIKKGATMDKAESWRSCISPSRRRCRFGNGHVATPLGALYLHMILRGGSGKFHSLPMGLDVVELDPPLNIAKKSFSYARGP